MVSKSVLLVSSNVYQLGIFKEYTQNPLLYAKTGQAGLRLIQEATPTWVFVSLQLDDMDALTFIQHIPSDRIPYIVVITSPFSHHKKVELMKLGVNDLIEEFDLESKLSMTLFRAEKFSSSIAKIQQLAKRVKKSVVKSLLNSFGELARSKRRLGHPFKPEEVTRFFPNLDPNLSLSRFLESVELEAIHTLLPQKIRVLIVEDEISIQDALTKVFRRHHFEVTELDTAQAALQQLATNEFDVAIVDIGLPGEMNGDELVGCIKKLKPMIDIVVLTAFDDNELIVNCFYRGASDYVLKPFDPESLVHRVSTQFKQTALGFLIDTTLKEFEINFEEYG